MWARSWVTAAALLLVTTSAGAATCEWMADQVDKAAMSPDISDEVKQRVIALRDEAMDNSPPGDDDVCQGPLIRAMEILNIKVE